VGLRRIASFRRKDAKVCSIHAGPSPGRDVSRVQLAALLVRSADCPTERLASI
jgi:hypothetical protein